jgi:hypothetical protein
MSGGIERGYPLRTISRYQFESHWAKALATSAHGLPGRGSKSRSASTDCWLARTPAPISMHIRDTTSADRPTNRERRQIRRSTSAALGWPGRASVETSSRGPSGHEPERVVVEVLVTVALQTEGFRAGTIRGHGPALRATYQPACGDPGSVLWRLPMLRETRRMLLTRWRSIAVGLVAAALGPAVADGSVSAARCASGTSFDALGEFLAGDDAAGLGGADYARAIDLPDGRVLWTFQDAFLTTGSSLVGSSFHHNLAMVQTAPASSSSARLPLMAGHGSAARWRRC